MFIRLSSSKRVVTHHILCDMISVYQPSRFLRSSSLNLVDQSRAQLKNNGERSFEYIGLKLWNSFPEHVKMLHLIRFEE